MLRCDKARAGFIIKCVLQGSIADVDYDSRLPALSQRHGRGLMKRKTEIPATGGDSATFASRSAPVRISQNDSTESAASAIFDLTLNHFVANREIFLKTQPVESVHQMRVALRRLRAAISLFRRALTGPSLDASALRAKAIATSLGEARDGDVFLELLATGPGAVEDAPDVAMLRAAAYARRDAGYRTANNILRDAATTLFIDDLRRVIAERDWRAEPDAREAGSVCGFARDALSRLQKRARRKSRDLATQTPESRHEARIALKKLRYAAEFFESPFGRHGASRAYIRTLAALQDGLGGFNDLAAANQQIDLLHANDGELALAATYVRGWFAHAAFASVEHAHQSEKKLKDLKPFW